MERFFVEPVQREELREKLLLLILPNAPDTELEYQFLDRHERRTGSNFPTQMGQLSLKQPQQPPSAGGICPLLPPNGVRVQDQSGVVPNY